MTADDLVVWVLRALLVGLVWGVVVTRVLGRRQAPPERTDDKHEDAA